MARKINVIYTEIIEAKQAEAHLAGLNSQAGETMQDFVAQLSNSRVSIWRMWCFILAFFLWLEEKKNDIFEQEFEEKAKQKQPTTLKWYQQKVLRFLTGKPLVWNDNLSQFIQETTPADDIEALRIVKHCAVTKSPNKLRVKIAGDNAGVPTILPTAQATAVESFLAQIASAGDNIEVVNNTADKIKIELDAYVNPLVINIGNGELHNEAGVKPVENAIKDYLFNLDFNGRFVRTYFIDRMQQAQGVSNIDLNILEHKYAGFPFTDIDVSVVPDAGYFEIENLTINYLPAEI